MKHFTLLITLFLGAYLTSFSHTDTLKTDIKKSNLKWVGSKISGSHHSGNISFKEGIIAINHGTLVYANFIVDMNSITCTDITNQKKAGYLVEHLKNEDFFDVTNHPQALLSLIRATNTDNGSNILAQLTIKGISKPVTFDANIQQRGNSVLISGKLNFDRTKYEIKYGSGSFFDDLGDKAINDEIELEFRIIAEILNGAHH